MAQKDGILCSVHSCRSTAASFINNARNTFSHLHTYGNKTKTLKDPRRHGTEWPGYIQIYIEGKTENNKLSRWDSSISGSGIIIPYKNI